jgi:hypothetical protein
MSKRILGRTHSSQASHTLYTEPRDLGEACDMILNKNRKRYRLSPAKRNINSNLGNAMVLSQKRPVTLPTITMREVKW